MLRGVDLTTLPPDKFMAVAVALMEEELGVQELEQILTRTSAIAAVDDGEDPSPWGPDPAMIASLDRDLSDMAAMPFPGMREAPMGVVA